MHHFSWADLLSVFSGLSGTRRPSTSPSFHLRPSICLHLHVFCMQMSDVSCAFKSERRRRGGPWWMMTVSLDAGVTFSWKVEWWVIAHAVIIPLSTCPLLALSLSYALSNCHFPCWKCIINGAENRGWLQFLQQWGTLCPSEAKDWCALLTCASSWCLTQHSQPRNAEIFSSFAFTLFSSVPNLLFNYYYLGCHIAFHATFWRVKHFTVKLQGYLTEENGDNNLMAISGL